MGRFDWQTEEEGPITPASATASIVRRRRWLSTLIVASLVGFVVIVGWQLERQAQIRDDAVRADVLAAFNVWLQAVVREDTDLLDTLLLNGGAEWTATQRRLLQTGRVLDRKDIGLTLVAGGLEVPDADATVELASTWRSAEITFPISYQTAGGDRDAGEVTLDQTLYFSREGARWLLRQPGEGFWGDWRTAIGEIASVTYRAKDEEVAEHFLINLDQDLLRTCASSLASTDCQTETKVAVRLESDPAILIKSVDQHSPSFLGRTFVLPSPTLVGKPMDESGYRALYLAYSAPILKTFEALLDTPIQLPDQSVAMLCFGRPDHVPRLYVYDPVDDMWQPELSDQAFSFLSADQNDKNVVLRQRMRGQPNRLRLLQWSGEAANLVHDEAYAPMTDHHVGWTGPLHQPTMLLATFQGTTRVPSYSHIDAESHQQTTCPPGGCTPQPLDGFPVWSPDGNNSLAVLDGEIFRADENGRALVNLGEGQSPFWLDEERYGFARPLSGNERQIIEVVTGVFGEDQLQRLWFTDQLDLSTSTSSLEKPIFIQHIESLKGRRPKLIMYGRQYAGVDSGYVFLTLPLTSSKGQLVAGPVQVELTIDRQPAPLPSASEPNGHVPFIISPDGRWLTVAYLADKASGLWHIQVVEIGGEAQALFSTHYPGYSFSHPFFDWSSDGRWLLIIDEDFMRLAAPATGFERVIAHDLRSCSYPAWINDNRAE